MGLDPTESDLRTVSGADTNRSIDYPVRARRASLFVVRVGLAGLPVLWQVG